MSTEYQDIEFIEGYLSNSLDDAERQNFETKLTNDPDFALLYHEIEQIVAGVQFAAHQRTTARAFLQNIQAQMPEPKPVPLSPEALQLIAQTSNETKQPEAKARQFVPIPALAAAASVAVVLFALVWLFFMEPKHEVLYDKYYTGPYPASGIIRGAEAEEPLTQFDEAMLAYNGQAFRTAIELMENELSNDPTNIHLRFYLGQSYLASEQAERALPLFEQLSADEYYEFIAQWYTALSLLKLDRKAEARDVLEKLQQGDTSYAERAKNLLEDL